MYKLLLDEPPLVVLPSLAKAIGLNESIVLQQVHYWLVNAREAKRRENFKKGRWWVYHTYPEWSETFPFWSEITIKRTFLELEKRGLVLSDRLADDRWDRSKWYTIDYEKYSATIEDALHERSHRAGEDPDTRDELTDGSASDQFDTLHRIRPIRSNGSEGYDSSDQGGPMHKVRSLRSKEEAKTTTETTKKTTADRSSHANDPSAAAAADPILISDLICAGLNRSDAARLAESYPDEARLQLAYLPYIAEFKSSPGAYLRRGIEQGFAAPKAYTDAQVAEAAAQRRAEAAAERRQRRQAEESQDNSAPGGDSMRDPVQAERARIEAEEPERFAKLLTAAEAKVPGGLQRKKGESYRRTREQILRNLIAEGMGN